MTDRDHATRLRALHAPGEILILPNAWDAGSARLVESCGAKAIATTSSGVAWSRGYADGNFLPPHVLVAEVRLIARVLSVPLTVDAEAGYARDPGAVAENVAALLDAGAVGVNLEDGGEPPGVLAAKIAAAKSAAARAGIDLFVNARTDVFLRGLVPEERRVAETLDRARQYAAAGCDGVFVPGARDPETIRALAEGISLPLNVMLWPGLPAAAELARLGVRRLSAGSAIAQAAHALTRRAAMQLLAEGRYDATSESALSYGELNALFPAP